MNLEKEKEKLRKKDLWDLTINDLKKIVWSKDRQELVKNDTRARMFGRISVYQTMFFLRLGFSANAVSGLWLFLAIAATFLLWIGNYWASLACIAIHYLAFMIDLSDGEVARYWNWRKKRSGYTIKGLYLESISHFLLRTFIFFGLGVGAAIRFGNIYYFYAGVALSMILLIDQVLKLREYDAIVLSGRINLIKDARKHKEKYSGKLNWFYNLFKPTMLHYSLFFWAALFNVLHWFLIATLVLSIPLLFKNIYYGSKKMDSYDK